MSFNPRTATRLDCYKFGHVFQYVDGLEYLQANLTPRGSRLPGIEAVLVAGIQGFLTEWHEAWEEGFFNRDLADVIADYDRRTSGMLGPNAVSSDHIIDLWNLGYMPLRFRALAEGTECPLRVPVMTIENTHPDFPWLVNYIETDLSAETWLPMTSATTALRLRRLLDMYADRTSDIPEFVDWQAHDFSFRGMTCIEAAMKSGAAHLLSFAGTDTVPTLDWIEYYYDTEGAFLGGSVAATEHSVMCAGTKEEEPDTYRRLITEVYPSGIASIVSDTWDLWNVLTNILPSLKDEIMARDGKIVIRPDSGDPADILCGTLEGFDPLAPAIKPEEKGVIELLWDVFGGTINSKGFKQLDPHVGAIYGDSITYERANDICRRLEAKGFASTNVVFGVGSFTYQHVTRDSLGFAMKTTWAQVDGETRDLFKDPVTDSGLKRSAKGRLAVHEIDGKPTLIENATREQEDSSDNLLRIVYENGTFYHTQSWKDIVNKVGVRYLT